jgi:hypothetical protein
VSRAWRLLLPPGLHVSKAYKPPFAFNGTIDSVEIKLSANKLSAADKKILEEAEKELVAGTN